MPLGSHDIKTGLQYQLGQHLRDDQRYTNGSFVFPTDLDFNAADPRTYPERFTVRVPDRRPGAHPHPIDRHLHARQVAGQLPNLTLNLGLRYDLHISPFDNPYNPFFADPGDYPVDKNNFQPRAGFAYNMGGSSVIRGGYGLFYEKQWIDRFEPYLLNRVFADSFLTDFPVNAADPGPSNGQFPTNPFLVNGPTVNRALLDQLFPAGQHLAATSATSSSTTPTASCRRSTS